jgi:hypothetical protein
MRVDNEPVPDALMHAPHAGIALAGCWTAKRLVTGKEIGHVSGGGCHPGKSIYTGGLEDESQSTFMLKESLRLISTLELRADHQRGDVTASMRGVGDISLIKSNDQQAAVLKAGVGQQGSDITLQP